MDSSLLEDFFIQKFLALLKVTLHLLPVKGIFHLKLNYVALNFSAVEIITKIKINFFLVFLK